MPTRSFSQNLLTWFDKYGRTDLPWQKKTTPYRVWISEVMLQQTQVNTVIPYYQRFVERFPDIQTLATASQDEVLHYWTGLGYYARARHLHKASQQICTEYGGILPTDFEKLIGLPGIGRSTGGAILALAHGLCYPILDGNVKRVLCRYHAIKGWVGDTKIANKLWLLAEKNTPKKRVADYTQAIMDLGATVCTRSKPHCQLCPFTEKCIAHQNRCETTYPTPKPRKTLPIKTTTFIMLQNSYGEVLLEKRPTKGIWGGLWSFPECPTTEDIPTWCQQHLNNIVSTCYTWQPVRHTFTHFHLDIIPVLISIETERCQMIGFKNIIWYNTNQPQVYGLAAPIVRLLAQLTVNKGELL
jgi:A/G-specific adenine glycosylase